MLSRKKRYRKNKRTIKALHGEAKSYYRRGEFTAAQAVYEQILSIDPNQEKAKLYVTKKLPPKIKLEIVAADKDVASIVTAIVANARTGEIGDGKIFILPIENAVRVRTGEEGEKAI